MAQRLSVKEAMSLIRADLYRYGGESSLVAIARNIRFNRSFRYTFWLRFSNCSSLALRRVARWQLRSTSWKTGIDIPASTKIGGGLYIGHGQSVIVNPNTVIGENCNLSQFTTIGGNDGKGATIGNNVYIGPNVCIVENVKIGDNVTIGAGSVVVKDVPENATVAGVPAKVLNFDNPGRYVGRRMRPG